MSLSSGRQPSDQGRAPSVFSRRAGLALERTDPRAVRVASAFVVPWRVFATMVRDRDLRRAWLASSGKVVLLTLALAVFAVSAPWARGPVQGDRARIDVVAPSEVPADSVTHDPARPERLAEPEAQAGPPADDERGWSWRNPYYRPPRAPGPRQQTLSALYAGLTLVENLLLGLFRDHQAQLSRRLCLATGAEPEDPEERPRVRVNWPWLKRKVQRRVRGFLIIGSGIVPIAVLLLVPGVGPLLCRVATAAWGFYWLAVFTLGMARGAWADDQPGEPFFVRACEAAGRAPAFGRPLRWYGRLWARLARTVRPGCLAAETMPCEAIGLALSRLLTVVPVINALVRPVMPVAAQLVLASRPLGDARSE